jgi:glycosyltransferase involved in cell wall biosynthesis
MRILFVTPYAPSPIRVRSFNFIRQLSRKHELALVTLLQGDPSEHESIVELCNYCTEIYTHNLTKVESLSSCCTHFFTGVPLQAAYTRSFSAKETVRRLSRNGAFDILHVEHIRGAYLAEGIDSIPLVYDSVDCITLLLKQRFTKASGIFDRLLQWEELIKMSSYEPKMASIFNRIIVTSKRDKRALDFLIRRYLNVLPSTRSKSFIPRPSQHGYLRGARLDGYNIHTELVSVVPNGVDTEYFQPINVPVQKGSIVFSGRMAYFANSDAALYFHDKVFPLVKAMVNNACFKIVGSDPPPFIRKLAGKQVEVTGYVADIRPYLASAEVVVCPLNAGVGIQNKVLEAMAMGKAVVATSVACKGIPGIVDGVHLLRADSPQDMAREIVNLMRDPLRRQMIGENARQFVVNSYSWETAVRMLVNVYEQVLETRTAVPYMAA